MSLIWCFELFYIRAHVYPCNKVLKDVNKILTNELASVLKDGVYLYCQRENIKNGF